MFLEQMEIVNFRGIRNLSVKFDETTVLIGENNTGKSTILDALQICLSRGLNRKGGIFSEYDYHLPQKDSQPVDSEAIEVTLRFVEQSDEDWPDSISQRLANAVQVDGNEKRSVILHISSKYDDLTQDYVTSWRFLDLSGNELINARDSRYLVSLQQLTPVFYLAALRDSAQEFRPRSHFWGPFVRSMKIEPALRQELEDELLNLNQRVLEAHGSFEAIKSHIGNTSNMVPLDSDDPVSVEAIPSKVFDILSRAQIMLGSATGARLPISRHGEGTQSLAVICLFDAFLQNQLEDSYTEDSSPILALEEPEAHLHPSAIRSIGNLLQGLKGQKVIATHSGDLVSGVSLTSLRRLRRRDSEIVIHQIEDGALTEEESQKIDYHIRSSRGSLLFARCWLLVEGETDRLLFEECARISGYDLISTGAFPLEYAHVGVEVLIKCADQLGIEWLLVTDRDEAGERYMRSARSQIGSRLEDNHIHMLAHGDIEVFLCMEGYGAVYEANISSQKRDSVTAQRGTLDYWVQVAKAQPDKSKPRNIVKVIEQIGVIGVEGIPAQIREILSVAFELAKEPRQ